MDLKLPDSTPSYSSSKLWEKNGLLSTAHQTATTTPRAEPTGQNNRSTPAHSKLQLLFWGAGALALVLLLAHSAEEEERRRLELQRRSQGVYWTEPHGDAHCHAYGTRPYHAYLRGVHEDLQWLDVCYNMPPVAIHGHKMSQPDQCERNSKGEIVGTWYVSSGEPSCITRWGEVKDTGCASGKPGFRRYEAPIQGVAAGDDPLKMCATTPAVIRGSKYTGADSCEVRKTWYGSKYTIGVWDVLDIWCLGGPSC